MRTMFKVYKTVNNKRKYVGKTPDRQQAINAGKNGARDTGCVYQVMMISENVGNRTVEYHPDGTVKKLWQLQQKQDA